MIKILIVDDHPVVRRGLKQILEEEHDMKVVGEACVGREVLKNVKETKCDIVILDITLPDRSGLDILNDMKRLYPKIHVLVLSMHPESQFAVRALKAGAGGYMTKDSAPEELIKAIRKISDGKKYISPTLAEKLADDLESGVGRSVHEFLSDREYQVLCMIASGKTLTQIGEELYLSVKTVSTYRARILEKMKLSTNADLIHYAIKNGLIS